MNANQTSENRSPKQTRIAKSETPSLVPARSRKSQVASRNWKLLLVVAGLLGLAAWGYAQSPAFTTSTFTVGTEDAGPASLAVADLNGDGQPDLVTANYGFRWALPGDPGGWNTNLVVLTNNGSGGFALHAALTVGRGPTAVVATDVNGDGRPDLISANETDNTLTVLTNQGGGGFALHATLPAGSRPHSLAAADVNGDGTPDLISANADADTLTVLTNQGGNFAFSATLPTGNLPLAVVGADFNGDGKPDLVSANRDSDSLTVLTNDGSGGFAFRATLAVGHYPNSVSAADLDGDGKVDLVSVDWGAATMTLLTNNGSGGFVLSATLAVGNYPSTVAAADFTGDGQTDLICASTEAHSLRVLTNNGAGVFGYNSTFATGRIPNVWPADLNLDGKQDLACPNFRDGTVTVLLNTTVFPNRWATNIIAAAVTPGGINQPGRTTNGVILYRYDGTSTGALQVVATLLPTPQNGLYDPAGVVFSPWGELFVGNRHGNQQGNPGSGSISRFLIDAAGQVTPNGVITGNGLWAVHDLAFSPAGELFAANLFADTISRFTFDRAHNAFAHGTIGAPAGSNLEGLAFSVSGELFASTYDAITRYRFDAQGNAVANGVIPKPGAGRLHFIRFNAAGELFAPDIDANRIYRFRFDGAGTASLNGSFAAAAPAGQVFSPAGELFVTTHDGPPLFNVGSLARFVFDAAGNAVANGSMPSNAASDPLGGIAMRLLDFPPTLTVTRTGDSTMSVSWPLPATGWRLHATANLAGGGATWNEILPPYQTNGGNLQVIEPSQSGPKFYRLHKP